MKDILNKIIEDKRIEVNDQKKIVTKSQMKDACRAVDRPCISMRKSLEVSNSGIISEFKRKSPSKGWINADANLAEVISGYEKAGAAAISVLTDNKYFGGSADDLKAARLIANIPLLRKEFIIDPYQIYQARALGADAILLIAACLTAQQCEALAQTAHSVGLEVLLELHCEQELAHVNKYIDMVGVNNRNLGTFVTDIAVSMRMATVLPKNILLVSESGISSSRTVIELRKVGYRGFLMGENFMKTQSPADALTDFIKEL